MKGTCKIMFVIFVSFFIPLALSSGTWTLIGLDGLNVQAIDVHPDRPDTILASANSTIYRTTNGGSTWQTVPSGIPAREILFHPVYTDTAFAVMGIGSYSDGIYRSLNAGESFGILNFFSWPTSIEIPICPQGHMYAGLDSSGGVWKSTNEGQTWFPYSDSLGDMNVISVFRIEPFAGDHSPLAGTRTGIYYRSTGNYWVKSNSVNLSCVSMTGALIGNPIYAALDGGSWSDGVYKSTDGGTNWNVSWFWVYITSVLDSPLNSQVVFAADSGYGVIMTTNGGDDWVEINENLGDLRVNDLAMSRSDTLHLYAATHSGLYVYDLSPGINEEKETKNSGITVNMPSMATCGSQISITCYTQKRMKGKMVLLTLNDITGRRVLRKKGQIESIRTEFQFELPHSSGIYFLTVNTEGMSFSEKLVVIKK
ncbi:T9SS type A sorting domain-containing protein [candidate division WOR-3 bacterium]|nr:T9SS type A sorting domain-containing protein [candidate division WOR-3 bacterium]